VLYFRDTDQMAVHHSMAVFGWYRAGGLAAMPVLSGVRRIISTLAAA